MLRSKITHALYHIYSLALAQEAVIELEALDIDRCRRCNETRYIVQEYSATLLAKYYNCLDVGHKYTICLQLYRR